MVVSHFLRQRGQAIADNTVSALLYLGVTVAIGWAINHFAPIWGLDPKLAFVLAWVVALLLAVVLSLLLKPKHSAPSDEAAKSNQPITVSPTISPTISPTVSPVIEAPTYEAPKYEAPKYEAPKIDIKIENNPSFTQSQSQSQEQRQHETERPDPVFESDDDPRAVTYGIDWRTKTLIRQTPTPEEISGAPDYITVVRAVLAPIYYRHDRGVEHTVYLSAHITFFTPAIKRLRRVIAGIWDGNPLQSSKRIQTGHSLELIVGLVPLDVSDWLMSAEYHQETIEDYMGKEAYDAPRLERIDGKEFLVKIDLVPKKISKDPYPIQPLWFNLLLGPDVKLIRTKPPTQTRISNQLSSPIKKQADPDIEFTNPLVVDGWVHPELGLVDVEPVPDFPFGSPESSKVQVMLARFYYKPDQGVPETIYVKAHISIADDNGVPIQARYDAVWNDEHENEYKEFDTAQTHALIIALLTADQEVNSIATVEYRNRNGEFDPETHHLIGDEFRLRLELIGKQNNERVFNKAFDFGLGLLPKPWMKLI